jgi:hypothetical protein
MSCRELIAVAQSISLVVFAFLTWRTTRSYAKFAGITLFIENFVAASNTAGAFRGAALDAMKMVRAEFPEIYDKLRKHLSKNQQEAIERTEGNGGAAS